MGRRFLLEGSLTISSVLNRTSLTGNGVTTSIPITFPFSTSADLVVLLVVIATGVQTTKTITTHYTVTGTPDALGHYINGGSVVMVTAPATGESVIVYRDPAKTQSLDLVENDSLPANNLEFQFDYITMLVQRLSDQLGRTVRQPDGDSAALSTLPSKVDRASKYSAYDASGNPIASSGTTSVIVTTQFAQTFLDDPDAATVRATLGVPAATNGTLASPIFTGIISGTALQAKRKSADQSVTSSIALQNDADFVLAVGVLEEWVGTIHLSIGAAIGTTGIKLAMTTPAGASVLYAASVIGDTSAKSASGHSIASGTVVDATAGLMVGCVNSTVVMQFWILNGATPGSLTLQFAQSTSSGTAVTVRKGSSLFAQRVA